MKSSQFSFLFILIILVSSIGLAYAETYKQYSDINFTQMITLDGAPNDNIVANITITDPSNNILVGFQPMTYDSINKTYNYTLLSTYTSQTGIYNRCIYAFATEGNKTVCYDFEVTPSGIKQNSILENPLIILFLILGIFLVGLGIYQGNAIFGFLGALLFIMNGVYVMIYGLNNVQDLYTRSLAGVSLGLGLIFMFVAAYEWLSWGED